MGYCMSMNECYIFIKNEVKSDALKDLKEFAKKKLNSGNDLMWININYDILEADNLELALDNIGWDTETDDIGNIIRLDFVREKLGDEKEIFNSIAKYFNEGSYIEMSGEDGGMWRWIFKDGKCRSIYPKIIWTE